MLISGPVTVTYKKTSPAMLRGTGECFSLLEKRLSLSVITFGWYTHSNLPFDSFAHPCVL